MHSERPLSLGGKLSVMQAFYDPDRTGGDKFPFQKGTDAPL